MTAIFSVMLATLACLIQNYNWSLLSQKNQKERVAFETGLIKTDLIAMWLYYTHPWILAVLDGIEKQENIQHNFHLSGKDKPIELQGETQCGCLIYGLNYSAGPVQCMCWTLPLFVWLLPESETLHSNYS